jgi:hypothetical protein
MSKDKTDRAERNRREKAERERVKKARKVQEKAEKTERERVKKARKVQEKADKADKDEAERARQSERAGIFRDFLSEAGPKGCCEPCNYYVRKNDEEPQRCKIGHEDAGPDKEICADCSDRRYHPKK